MCGIVGIIGTDRDAIERGVAASTTALAHRGPDGEGQELHRFGRGWVGLGFRRLAILDLSSLGSQPMIHAPSGARIVFNGEIYNYRWLRAELERDGEIFRGHSDTEVLLAGLARHGSAFLSRLEGMFAFAYLDPRRRSILLARDPAGIKPLYVAETAGTFVFASEVRALLATGVVRPKLDRLGMAGFLAYGAVQHPLTLFHGITSLDAGSSLLLRAREDGSWEKSGPPTVFWSLPAPRADITEQEAISAVRDTLDRAVKDHLVADVPVGLFLSSGMDSTILAGLAARHCSSLRTFTVGFSDQPDFSEQKLAARTAKLFGLDHVDISLPMGAAEAAMIDWLAALDQPSIDGLNTFVISRAVRERGIKVALSGLGADELFGGYPSFREVPRLRWLARLMRPLSAGMRARMAGLATVGRPRAVRAKLVDMLGSDGSIRSLYLHRRRAMSDQQLASLDVRAANIGLTADFLATGATDGVDVDGADPIRMLSQLEFRCYQGNMLLRDADANGMAAGLEIRVPFLARQMLDLAHCLPGPVRLPRGARGKHLLRKAFADLIPSAILEQPKRGFILPISKWMAGSLRPRCERALSSLKDTGLLAPAGVDSVWGAFRAEPDSPMWTRAFALVVLGEFIQKFGGDHL